MAVATSRIEVGIRDLKNNLSRHLDDVRAGQVIIVTDRGRPIARVVPLDESEDRLADLVAAGKVRPPTNPTSPRWVPTPVKATGSVSDLVAEQRR